MQRRTLLAGREKLIKPIIILSYKSVVNVVNSQSVTKMLCLYYKNVISYDLCYWSTLAISKCASPHRGMAKVKRITRSM
jgi:hypothetical protein